MFVVLDHEILSSWFSGPDMENATRDERPDHRAGASVSEDSSKLVYGKLVDDGDVIRITPGKVAGAEPVGMVVSRTAWDEQGPSLRRRLGRKPLLLVLGPDADAAPACWTWRGGQWESVPVDVVRLVADFQKRHKGLFDVGYLGQRTVTVVGLGSGGGMVASQLARTGVGGFRLVDFDRLEVHNIARHVCDLDDLGRQKTMALADHLRRINPSVRVEVFNCNVLHSPDMLEEAIRGADLVVAATDSEASKSLLNRMSWQHGVPAVYGAAYNRAFGGDLFRVVPPDGACYACLQEHVGEMFESQPRQSEIDYASIEDPTRFVAEPGLGTDVALIALLLTKLTLLTLLRDTESQLPDFPTNYLMWGNQAMWIFDHPLQPLFIDVPRRTACEVCDREVWRQRQLAGLTPEEVKRRTDELLASVSTAPLPQRPRPAGSAATGGDGGDAR